MNASDFVILRSGLTLPLAAVRLALDLENRGLELTVEGESLAVGPRDRITDHDRTEIRRWRDHLIAIVSEAQRSAIQ
jgi:hypothetical protein